jgi:hypothetical protein
MCGARLSGNFNGIYGLVYHIDNRIKSLKKTAVDYPDGSVHDRAVRALEKWVPWQTALKELMDDAPK